MTSTGVEIPATPPTNAPGEPLVSVGGVTSAASAVIALVVAFGLHLSDTQTGSILGVIAVLAPIVVTVVGRKKVFAPDTVRAMVLNAENNGNKKLI
jgi:hypothetical protein